MEMLGVCVCVCALPNLPRLGLFAEEPARLHLLLSHARKYLAILVRRFGYPRCQTYLVLVVVGIRTQVA